LRIVIEWPSLLRNLAIISAIALFLAIINPYGAMTNAPFLLGFALWFLMIAIGSMAGIATTGWLCRNDQSPPLPVLVGASALTSSIAVIGLIEVFRLVWQDRVGIPGPQGNFLYVFVIAVAVTGVYMLVDRRNASADTAASALLDTPTPTETFLKRLPVKFHTADLYAITSEDHYLRVYTSHGDELILMRLSDAARELGGARGLQVHRSWWVAAEAIQDVRKENGRSFLVLPGGVEAPVSRRYRDAVRALGVEV